MCRVPSAWLTRVAVATTALTLSACGPNVLDHVVESPVLIEFELPAAARELVIRLPLGSVTVEAGEARALRFDGSIRLAAANEEDLARLVEIGAEPVLGAGESEGVYVFEPPAIAEELGAGTDAGGEHAPPTHVRILRANVRLPRELDLRIETGRGHLSVTDRDGDVALHTGSGDIKLESVRGDATAFTGRGHCVAVEHRGELDIKTGFGSILAYVHEVSEAGIRLDTRAPSITLRLPESLQFELDARVERCERARDLRTVFGVPVVPLLEDGLAATGTVGAGGPTVTLIVGRGHLSITTLK